MDYQTLENRILWQIVQEKVPKQYTLSELIGELKNNLEQNQNVAERKKRSNSFKMQKEDLPDEVWKSHPGKGWNKYQISNLGRIKHNGKIVPQKDKDEKTTGWLVLDKEKFGSSVETGVYVYRMVAETWLIKDGNQEETFGEWHVHHISNNGYDNRPENLIWLRKTLHFDKVHKPAREK